MYVNCNLTSLYFETIKMVTHMYRMSLCIEMKIKIINLNDDHN